MGRSQRSAVGNVIYHVLNRANGKLPIFKKEFDYLAFENILTEAKEKFSMRILSYCLMPNHWHLVLHPYKDNDLSRYMQWVTLTHTQRWHTHTESVGFGHLYQGRFKSFPVQQDEHFLQLCRYVERNALQAHLVLRAELWKWSSLWRRKYGNAKQKSLLTKWPIFEGVDYAEWVNEKFPHEKIESDEIEISIQRGRPYGSDLWIAKIAKELGLQSSLRPPNRPKKGV